MRLACLLGFCLSVSACAPLLTAMGSNLTLVQTVANLEKIKLAGDGVSFASSQKTITDHAISYALGKDCKMFNVLTKKSVCSDTPIVAIKAPEKADTPSQIAALDSSIKTAADGELQTAEEHPEAGMLTAGAGLQPVADTPDRISALDGNIRQASLRAPTVGMIKSVDATVAVVTAGEKPEPSAPIAGTDLTRSADAALSQPDSQKEEAPKSSAPQNISPAQAPAGTQPETIAHPAARTIDVSSELASG